MCLVRIARVLSPEGYGNYVLILTAVSIAQVIAMLGLPQIIIRAVSRNSDALTLIAKEVLPLVVSGSFVAGIGVAAYLLMFANAVPSLALVAGMVLVVSQGFWMFAESLAFGKQQMHYSSILNVGGSLFWAAMVFLLPQRYFSVEIVLLGFSIIQISRSISYLFIEWRNNYFRKDQHNTPARDYSRSSFLKQSLPLFGTNVLTIPISQLPILFLGKFSGIAEVGYFGLGNRLVAPLFLISGSLVTAVYPILAHSFVQDRQGYIAQVQKLFLGLSAVGFFFSLTLGLFSKEIVLVFFGAQYSPGIIPFAIQIWTACIIMMLSFIGNLFLSANKERTLVLLSVSNCVIIGASSYIGARFGALGLAMGSWASFVVGFCVHWIFVRRKIMTTALAPKHIETVIFLSYILLSALTLYLNDIPFLERAAVYVSGIIVAVVIARNQLLELMAYLRSVFVH